MKLHFLMAIIFCLSLLSCKKTAVEVDGPQAGYTRSEGLIFGADPRECMCCGGWFVTINTDTLRIFNMPQSFDDTLATKTMPVKVTLDWKKMTEGCGSTMPEIIEVNKIKMKY